MQKKKTVIFYESYWETIAKLPTAKSRDKLYNAIFEYAFTGKEPDYSTYSDAEYTIITLALPTVDACIRNYINGCKGGAPLGNQNAAKNKNQPEVVSEVDLKKTTNKYKYKNKYDNKNKYTDISIPTLDNIRDYCLENNLHKVNPIKFSNYYESKGWDKVTSWTDALTAWNKNEITEDSERGAEND